VVNGIAVNSIDDISTQMVKSIEILKGSSASIYGSKGSNGVILIYLKGTPDNKK
jgi:TonB-dependent SusC/RagA subfamily outer membrane receptor